MSSTRGRSQAELWIHAVAAKAGGGITYLRNIVPELVRQLDGRGVRVVLLLPGPWQGEELPEWVEIRALPRIASNPFLRILFDQVLFPAWLVCRPNVRAYCSGSFSPLVKTAPTVVLLRNAIYFDDEFLRLVFPLRRLWARLRGALIAWAARGCAAVHYPSAAMRDLVEAKHPGLRGAGFVNSYGVGTALARPPRAGTAKHDDSRATFLYVMNYTPQKNLGFVLDALALAREAKLPVRVVVTSRLDRGERACLVHDRSVIEENRLVEEGYLELVGSKFGDDLVALYDRVDGCLFPSICESFGHPLVEALALRKPIIAADRPYAREICGLHAKYVDPKCAETLVEIWRTGSWRHSSSIPLDSRDVLDRFSWRRHVANLLDALLRDVDHPGKRPGLDVWSMSVEEAV
jgi:glycosyltransferase involved in cell wall biosynthesis